MATLRTFAAIGCAMAVLPGCVRPAPPAPAVQRVAPPPWPAPRDAISYIDAAGLPHVRLDATDHQRLLNLRITVDGRAVTPPAGVGVDRIRAVQAPAHTHDDSGRIWLEGEGTDAVTLGRFFTLWGVRFDDRCLGSACVGMLVTADDRPVTAPTGLRLVDVQREVAIAVRSS